jgi:hypothetical protein
MLLSEINKHEFDSRIRFRDQGHKYWIDNDDTDLISSTTFIHNFFEHFDENEGIKKIINGSKYKNPDYEYYNMTPKEIKKIWDQSRDLGTKMHKDIEDFYNDIDVKNDTDEFKQFLQFYKDHENLKIYRTEWLIFADVFRITGSIDATFINDDGTLTLGDWKRSKNINIESYNEKMGFFPLKNVPDCNYYHYSLQLNLYRTILEKFYGKRIKEMFLVVLHPKNKNEYKKIMVKKMDREIQVMLDSRKQELIKKGYSEKDLNTVSLEYTLKDVDPEIFEENEEIKPIKSFLRNKNKEITKSILKTENNAVKSKSFLRNKNMIKKDEINSKSITSNIKSFFKEENKKIKLDNLTYESLSNKQKKSI